MAAFPSSNSSKLFYYPSSPLHHKKHINPPSLIAMLARSICLLLSPTLQLISEWLAYFIIVTYLKKKLHGSFDIGGSS